MKGLTYENEAGMKMSDAEKYGKRKRNLNCN